MIIEQTIRDQGTNGGHVLSIDITKAHVTLSTSHRNEGNRTDVTIFDCDLAELEKMANGILAYIESVPTTIIS